MSRARERGVALVLVIWLTALMMVAAGSFMFAARTDMLVVRNSVSLARAEAAADAGIMRAVFEVYRIDNSPEAWKRDGARQSWVFDGAAVTVSMRDESAKIDLNTASDALLRGLLVSQGVAEEDANKLLDAILDWRDADPLKRLNGAEEAEYTAAGLAWRPANAPFQAIEEIQLVLGMRPDVYRRIAPLVTVYSRQAGVTTNTAERAVLLAIPGLTPEIVDAYIARREEARAAGAPLPLFAEAGAHAAPPSSLVASVRSEAKLDDGAVFVREAVALLRSVPRKPVTFLAWRSAHTPEASADSPEVPEAAAADAARTAGARN